MKPRLTISDLSPAAARTSRHRVGRGVGSGWGKTAGRGQKGARSRSGWHAKRGFEGGQMPLARRLPKAGFISPFRVEYKAVNIALLDRFEDGAVVDSQALKSAGLVDGRKPIKILAKGKLERKLTVKAHAFSEAAIAAIKAAGGTAETIEA
jgi:large subunit ribosomal protein L15